jgi:predicted phage terminase large subunit-like protein
VTKKPDNQEIAAYQKKVAAAKRLLAAQKSRTSFLDFARLMMPDIEDVDNPDKSRFLVAPHHRLLAEALEKVSRGEILRLCISLAPRHGKSEMCSRLFPAWFLGQDPYRQIILAGASGDFATAEFGRKIKSIVTSPMYRQVFPKASLHGGSKSVENLVFTEGGNIKSIGKGAQVVGRGADLLVIDDPISGLEEAMSPSEREKLWGWFTSDAMSRLMPGGRVIVIHQRWHNSDLIGRLVDPECPEYDPEIASKWTHVKLPAVIDSENLSTALGIPLAVQTDPEITAQFGTNPISALWPERFGLKFFAELRRQNPKSFEALYRGTPRLEEGNFFKGEWFKGYKPHELPRNLRTYMAGDFAVSTKQTADKTCLIPVGVDEQGTVWVLPDVVWRRMDAEATVEAIIDMVKRHKPLYFWAEKGHISQSLGPFLRKRMQEEGANCAIVEKTPVKDKLTRAQSFNALVSLGRVRFPTFAPWWRDAEAEMLRFPEAAHDDFVDCAAWLGIGIAMQTKASKPRQKDTGPREGTLAWIKGASKWEAKQKRLAMADGF